MENEIEAKFANVDKNEIRAKLRKVGAELIKPEFLQKRTVFNLPKSSPLPTGWLRVRDEGGQITMSLKSVDGSGIMDQKEICLKIDDYESGVSLLRNLGAEEKAYQETRRELWKLDGCEIMLDEWPFVEPFVEVEGESEEDVRRVSEVLGFAWEDAKFGAVDVLYSPKYNISKERINQQTPLIKFEMENPFL